MQIIGRQFSVGPVGYSITREINSGGFGTVYMAEAPPASNAPPLAVKVPAPHVIKEDEWRRRFQREARILGNINHRNVVRTMGLLNYSDGALLLVQELIDNAQELMAISYADPEVHLSYALQVLYGLRITHGKSEDSRAVHRDLSPRNVLISHTGLAKIIDFGLAKEDPRTTTILTVAGYAFGTPGCMAPEQHVSTATVDHRADLYAFGRTFAAVIQRRRPEYVDIQTLPDPWRDVIDNVTKYDPDSRLPDATAVIDRLLHDFAVEGVRPAHPGLHVSEIASFGEVTSSMVHYVADYFVTGTRDMNDLHLAYLLRQPVLSNPHFKVGLIYKRLYDDVIEPMFCRGLASFDDCDPLGTMLREWYSYLEEGQALELFELLCALSLQYHRYSLMGDIRFLIHRENDASRKAKLVAIVDRIDPAHTIHGKGVIPGRDP